MAPGTGPSRHGLCRPATGHHGGGQEHDSDPARASTTPAKATAFRGDTHLRRDTGPTRVRRQRWPRNGDRTARVVGGNVVQTVIAAVRRGRARRIDAQQLVGDEQPLPIRLSPTATSGSVRPCSWTFTSVAIFGSHNRSQSSSDFFPTTRPAPPTWRRLAGATGLFAPIVRRRESRSASQIVLASCAAASAAVTPD